MPAILRRAVERLLRFEPDEHPIEDLTAGVNRICDELDEEKRRDGE